MKFIHLWIFFVKNGDYVYFCIMTRMNRTISVTLVAAIALLLPLILPGVSECRGQGEKKIIVMEDGRNAERFRRYLQTLSTDSIFRIGTTYIETPPYKPDSALMCYMTAISRVEDSDGDMVAMNAIAKSYVNTAFIYSSIFNDYSEAYSNLKKAEKICVDNGLDKVLAHVYHGMGVANGSERSMNSSGGPEASSPESFELFKKAFNLGEKSGYYGIMGYSLFSMVALPDAFNSPEVKEYVERYLAADIPDTEITKEYFMLLARGVKAYVERRPDEARVYFNELDSVDIPANASSIVMRNYGRFLIGLTYETSGFPEKTDSILHALWNDARASGDYDWEMSIAGNLYLFYKRQGNETEADRYLLEYYKVRERIASMPGDTDSIDEIELREAVSEYEMLLRVAALKERQQRMLLIAGGIASLCVILVLVGSLYWSRKRRGYITMLYEKNLQLAKVSENPGVAPDGSPEEAEAMPLADDKASPEEKDEPDAELVEKIVKVMSDPAFVFDPDFQMARLSAEVGTNNTYVSRAVNAHYGKPFKNVLAEIRIKEACRRFDNPSDNALFTVEAICREVGFKSRAAFSVAFKNITGLTPTEYRNAARRYMPPVEK